MNSPAPQSQVNPSERNVPLSERIASSFLLDWLGTLAIFFVYAGEAVPGVNEPHYWTKAYHFWHPGFGRGDLFLESGDAHWLFFATFGYFTKLLPLFWAVWTVRFLMWTGLAFGWAWMIRNAIAPPPDSHEIRRSTRARLPLLSTVTAAGWLAALHWGHWAGEWVVGGAEAKEIAYAFLFGGLGYLFRRQWTPGWVLLGIGSAFHVVTGAWVILCTMIVLGVLRVWRSEPLPQDNFRSWISKQWIGLVACGLISLVGIIPALLIDWGTPSEITSQAAVKQVYGRLSHHLAPSMISSFRWQSFTLMLFVAGAVYWLLQQCYSRNESSENEGLPELPPTKQTYVLGLIPNDLPLGIKFLALNAIVAFAIAVFGCLVDRIVGPMSKELASKVLRFYWFRWNDVSLPLAVATVVAAVAYDRIRFGADRWMAQISACLLLLIASTAVIGVRYNQNTSDWIPYGDRAKLISKDDTEIDQRRHYNDWLNVCEWIRQNTDPDALWLTPRNQQSFKWHTGRAELANWKDMPQDARSIAEWTRRLDDAFQFEGEKKILQPWTEAKLWELHEKYHVRYVLMDRRVLEQKPPILPILYPPNDQVNSTFSVFEFVGSPILLPSESATKPSVDAIPRDGSVDEPQPPVVEPIPQNKSNESP